MSYRHTIEAVLESIHDIEDLVNGFPQSGNIPSVELDLALQKLRNLYELMLMIRRVSEQVPEHKSEPLTERKAEPEIELKTEQVAERKPEPALETKPEPAHGASQPSTIVETVEHHITETTEQRIVEKKEQVKRIRPERNMETLSDQFKDRTTLLESLHQTYSSETIAFTKPVADLMSAIAINDRFTFIRELFNNDKAAFENAISLLNNSANFNDAYNYMITQHSWDMDSIEVQQLLDIIRRKYIKRRNE